MNQVIKIKSQGNTTVPAQSSVVSDAWVLIRTSSKSSLVVKKLPLTIGSSTDSDIIVNASTMRPVSKIILEHKNELIMSDAQTLEKLPVCELGIFGIEIFGPFSENPENMTFLKLKTQKLLAFEKFAFNHRYPPIGRKFLPSTQILRLATMVLAFLMLTFLVFGEGGSDEALVDMSKKPIKLAQGNIVHLNVKSPGINSSYASGVTLNLGQIKRREVENYTFTLSISGLDIEKEFSVYFNKKLIGATKANMSCLDSFCSVDFSVSSSVISDDSNEIYISHEVPESSYAIRYAFFRNMEKASQEDIETCNQLIASASRFYDERHLLVQNIRQAKDAIEEAENIIINHTGLEDVQAKFAYAKKQIEIAFKETSDDLKFRVEKEIQLGHNKQALAILNDMLKLYPNPSSSQYNFLSQQRKKLQEQEK